MLLFTIILTLLIFSFALAPIILHNAVYSVLCFIAVFLFISGILLSLGIEFLAFVYAIVYIGAVAVLFLFVVMLLQVSSHYKRALNTYWIIWLVMFVSIITLKLAKVVIQAINLPTNILALDAPLPENAKVLIKNDFTYYAIKIPSSELYLISNKFYNLFSMLFLETAFILLLALIAVIILTKTIAKKKK